MSFTKLPNEVLDKIVQELITPDQVSFAQTCRRLYSHGGSSLGHNYNMLRSFRKVAFGFVLSGHQPRDSPAIYRTDPLTLLYNLGAAPWIAGHVRELTCSGAFSHMPSYPHVLPLRAPAFVRHGLRKLANETYFFHELYARCNWWNYRLSQAAVENIRFQNFIDFGNCIADDTRTTSRPLPVIFQLLSNPERLNLASLQLLTERNSFFRTVSQRLCPQDLFQNLRILEISRDELTGTRLSLDFARFLMHIPSLQLIRGVDVDDWTNQLEMPGS